MAMFPLSNSLRDALRRCSEAVTVLRIRLCIYWLSFLRHREYRYEPLAPSALRLLTILPPFTTRRDEPIRCLLNHVALDDYTAEYKNWEHKTGHDSRKKPYKARLAWTNIQGVQPVGTRNGQPQKSGLDQARIAPRYAWGDYLALSYCWGSGENRSLRNILINDRLVQVTENLEAALRFYRTLESSETKVLIWADAICINQSDEEEKPRELLRMREIYAGATGVLVHLGPENDNSNRGIDVVQRTASDVAVDQGSSRRLELLQNRENPCASVRRDVVALLNIMSRPYWRRLWILQEIAMADGSLILGYGDRRVRLTDVLLAAKFLWQNLEAILLISGDVWKHVMAVHGSLWVLLFFDKLQDLQRHFDQPKITFADLQMPLLNLGQNALSGKAHDKVFGLLGILPEGIGSKMKQYVNYGIPTDQLFVTFTKAIIEYTGTLDVILARPYDQAMKPSWATDWTLMYDRVNLNHDWTTYDYNHFEKAYPDLRKMVDTSLELRADGTNSSQQDQFSFCDQSLLLTCSAILIGQVDGMAPDMPRVGNSVSSGVITQPKQEVSPYGDAKATSQALIHTLFANPMWGDSEDSALFHIPWMSADYYNTPQHDQDFNIDGSWDENVEQMMRNGWDFLLLYGNFLSFEYFRRRLGRFRIGGKRFQDYFVQSIGQCRLPQDRVRLDVAKLVGAHLARRLITLSTGHFGLAPNTTQPNDQIYVVSSCSVPLVLRPKPDTGHFEVVGECYVEGYAKGEARKAVDEGKFAIQRIILC